jgi:hypothetical protein
LVPYFLGLLALSYLGSFGGGIGWLTFGWDLLAVAVFSLAIFYLAYLCRLPREKVLRYLDEEAGFERAEYKEDDTSL